MTKYFFIDYDNTLFSHHSQSVPASAITALLELQKAGHKVILASGRPFRGDVSDYLGKDFVPDAIAGANGALLEVGGHLLRETYFNPELQKRLMDFAMERSYCLMTFYENRWYVTSLERLKQRRAVNLIHEIPLDKDDFLKLKDKPLLSFFMDEEEDAFRELEAHFPEVKLLRMGSEMGGADVIPGENGKAKSMLYLLNYFGASAEDAVAIGDSMNDIEMIQTAGLGIAMGNAMKDVQAAADYVAKDIDEDGLADAVRYALEQSAQGR